MERFEEIYDDFQKARLDCEEAAMILGCSVRHFFRLRERYDEDGLVGLKDRRVGRVSKRRAADAEIAKVTKLYRERYDGFNVRHFHEFAKREHGLKRGYTWTRTVLVRAGVVSPVKQGGAHRLRRPRKPMRGMMLHQDASKHPWFGEDYCDLVVTMDDATSEITSAFFCAEEGTMSSFRGIHETIVKHGLFCSLYTDRGSHYFYTPEVGGKVDKSRPTQVNRALKQLGIDHIAAYSPEARGRSERMFGTLQDRLVNELKLAGIATMDKANHYLRNSYLPRHNERFMVKPESDKSAFIPVAGYDIANILCIQEERVVAGDNTVSYQGKKLQLPKSDTRHHYVKCKVRVHHYPDDTLAIFHGPREIGRYNADGLLKQEEKRIAA
jgi:transposase